MHPTNFEGSNKRLLPPAGHEDDVTPLWVRHHNGICTSTWKMTWRERLRVLMTGRIWFSAWGRTHPPVMLSTERPFDGGSDA